MVDDVDWEAPTSEVIEAALADVKELVQIEIALAKDDLRREALAARRAVIVWCVAIVFFATGSGLLLLSWALSLSNGVAPALTMGFVLLLGSAGATLQGIRFWPESLLGRTERRVGRDIEQLKEHLA